MNGPNESGSTPWRRLHEKLAKEFAGEIPDHGAALRGSAQLEIRVIPTGSWLVRARSRKAQVFPRTT
jgi:hypothetical protein